jgi:SAM-dependent methyltransferase
MFKELEHINSRPKPWEFYTAKELWAEEHTSQKMLEYHLNDAVDLSSRNTEFVDRSTEWIVSRFGVDVNTAVADFGCGPGLYTTRLAKTGADVTGIDFSERSIRYARQVADRKGLMIEYVNEDYLAFDTDQRFDLVTMIFCDFCALSPAQRKHLLEKFHRLLKKDGSVLLDVHSLNVFDQKEESTTYELNQLDGFWSPNPYYGFLNSFKYEEVNVFVDKYTIVEESKTRTVYNWIQCFSPESLAIEFEETGFKIENFFADVAGTAFTEDSDEIAVVATKSD